MKIKLNQLAALMGIFLYDPSAHAAAPDLAAGKAAFAKCASCHQVGKFAQGGFGPQLNGVIGRAAGSTADFKYSPAMKASRLTWTEKNLAAFLRAPGEVVPGNKMRFWGIGNSQEIANLLAYLRTLPAYN